MLSWTLTQCRGHNLITAKLFLSLLLDLAVFKFVVRFSDVGHVVRCKRCCQMLAMLSTLCFWFSVEEKGPRVPTEDNRKGAERCFNLFLLS